MIVSEFKFGNFWNFFVLLENWEVWNFLHFNISFEVFLQRLFQWTIFVHSSWVIRLLRKCECSFQVIEALFSLNLSLDVFSSQLSSYNSWYFFIGIFNKIVNIIFGLRTFWASRILIEVSQKLLNFVFLLFFVIKLGQFKLCVGLQIVVSVIGNEFFESILLHFDFPLEVSQFVGVVRIERNVFYQILSFEVLLLVVSDGFFIIDNFLLLVFLVGRFNFRLVLFALLFLLQQFIHVGLALCFSDADFGLGRWNAWRLCLLGNFKVELDWARLWNVLGLIWKTIFQSLSYALDSHHLF